MKYFRTFLLSMQSQIQNRANLIGWLVVGAVPSVTLVIVWFAILGNNASINGFTRGDFIVYYFFQTISWYIVGGTYSRTLGDRIKNGDVNKSLVKPYSVVLESAIREQGWKVVSFILAIPAILFVLFLFRGLIHIQFTSIQISLVCISLILGGINFALLEAISGCAAFWVSHVWPIADMFDILLSLFGGRLVPITLMPLLLQNISSVLPFKYVFYISVSILLNKSPNPFVDVAIQGCIVLLLFLCYKLIWHLGIRRYEAVGG